MSTYRSGEQSEMRRISRPAIPALAPLSINEWVKSPSVDSMISPVGMGTGGSLGEEVMIRTCRDWGGVTEGVIPDERDAGGGGASRRLVSELMPSYQSSTLDSVESYSRGDHESCRVIWMRGRDFHSLSVKGRLVRWARPLMMSKGIT